MNLCPMTLTNTHMKTQMIETSLGFILVLVEFKEQLINYLDNLMGLNYIGKKMQKGRKDGGDRWHLQSRLCPIKALCLQLHLSYLSNDWSCHGHIRVLQDLIALKSFAWECQQKQGEKAHFRRFQISSCRCRGHGGESFACDFQFEGGPCWEGIF
jgi:hypothetical protein